MLLFSAVLFLLGKTDPVPVNACIFEDISAVFRNDLRPLGPKYH